MIAIGTLMRKHHCQPAYSVRMPPRSTPMAAPDPAIAPRIPSALFRSAPSTNVTETIENTDGARSAAPAPCRILNVTSIVDDVDRPHSSEQIANAMSPAMNTFLRPSRSPMRPPSSRNPPKVSA
jgi:hypothetical protein